MTAPAAKPVTVPDFRAAKGQRKLAVVTAYDFTAAKLADAAGVDAILVGDSLGKVVQGYATSLPVTMEHMAYHTACVVRGTSRALVIADLPFGSYQESKQQAIRSAVRLIQAGAAAVKLEGGERMAATIAALVNAEIPVMAHIGLTPQSVHKFGGFKVQRDAEILRRDAEAVAAAGAFSVVVECVPSADAKTVTGAVSIPTIGIGAGPDCDGQVLVFHDLLGLNPGFAPRFVRPFADGNKLVTEGLSSFAASVTDGTFPSKKESY